MVGRKIICKANDKSGSRVTWSCARICLRTADAIIVPDVDIQGVHYNISYRRGIFFFKSDRTRKLADCDELNRIVWYF